MHSRAPSPFVAQPFGLGDIMRAAVYRRFGGPEVVAIEEVAKPVPKAGEVLAVSYTHLDVYKRQGVGAVVVGDVTAGTQQGPHRSAQ